MNESIPLPSVHRVRAFASEISEDCRGNLKRLFKLLSGNRSYLMVAQEMGITPTLLYRIVRRGVSRWLDGNPGRARRFFAWKGSCAVCEGRPQIVAEQLCKLHRNRKTRYGDARYIPPSKRSPAQKLLAGSKSPTESGCVEFVAYRNDLGYGQLCGQYAHRLAWQVFVGPIPRGMWVLHHCDNPSCVNVHHLYIGTAEDNAADRALHGKSVAERRKLRKSMASYSTLWR